MSKHGWTLSISLIILSASIANSFHYDSCICKMHLVKDLVPHANQEGSGSWWVTSVRISITYSVENTHTITVTVGKKYIK